MMNFKSKSLAILLMAGAATVPLAQADDVAIVLSPNGTPEAKRGEVMDMLKLATSVVEPGETAVFIDGLNNKTICTLAVPNRKAYRSEKAKLTVNAPCVGALLSVAKAADADAVAGQLDLPRTYRMIGQSLDMDVIDAVVVLGSPIHDHADEPSTTMAVGHVPSDGHITASLGHSPYGMAGLEDAFKGTPVHFSSEGYEWIRNSRHEDMVHRFHGLMADTLGSPLVTFNNDRAQLIKQVSKGVDQAAMSFERSASQKLEMIHVGLDLAPSTPIHERPVTETPLRGAELRRAIDVEVGINWSCACDMDIYVRPNAGAETVFYGNVLTNEGRFYRDYRNGRDLLNGLETISLHAPVDLSDMVIAVNFYSGEAPDGVSGEVRLAVGDKTYAKPFEISAQTGNQAKGAEAAIQNGAAPDAFWVVMTGADVVSAD